MEIETDRLILRRWQERDLEPFVSLNADPRVMEFFPTTLSRAETEVMISSIDQRIGREGFGFWAAELKVTKALIGFIGLTCQAMYFRFLLVWKLVGGWHSIAGAEGMPKREHVQPWPSVLKT